MPLFKIDNMYSKCNNFTIPTLIICLALRIYILYSFLSHNRPPEAVSPLHTFFFTGARKVSRHVEVAEWVLSSLGIPHDGVQGAFLLSLFELGAQLGVHCS